jgi:hypothetical protein
MKNRIKKAFAHLTDTDIEKIMNQNIDMSAPDGASGRIEAIVMKKIAESPESDNAFSATATPIMKKPRRKWVFRRTIVIAAAVVLALALTIGIAAQTGKIRQIFWFGKTGLESTEIIGTGEEEPVPAGFYLLNEPFTFGIITLNYAVVFPSEDGTCSLRIFASAPSVQFSSGEFKLYITFPDGSEYSDPYPNRGSYSGGFSNVVSLIEGIPAVNGEVCNFTLHIESQGESFTTEVSLAAADSSVFSDRLSTVEWNGITLSMLTFGYGFNAVLVRVDYNSKTCMLPEMKKILEAAEKNKEKIFIIKPLMQLKSSDGKGTSYSGIGENNYIDNYNFSLYIPDDPLFKISYITVSGISIRCTKLKEGETFDGTYNINLDQLTEEGKTGVNGYTADFINKYNDTITNGYWAIFLTPVPEIKITLK